MADDKVTPVSSSKDELSYDERPVSENSIAFDKQATARLLRKIDWTLIPFLSLLYL